MLVNEISTIKRDFALVLDDCHVITTQAIHDALGFLLNRMPPALHLVIVGRVDPPFPLARFRVQGQMIEVRTPELCFTEAEVAAFLNDLLGLGLSSEDIASLEARTEGWAASLQLAGLSLQGRRDRKECIAAFSGSHRYVIDYLVDEVMSLQTQEMRTFLRQTSILDRFCAPLCDAVLDTSGSRRTLVADEHVWQSGGA